jgi:hypothetical protein
MPNLMLGNIAKEAAKLRFRNYNITLPAISANYAGSPLRTQLSLQASSRAIFEGRSSGQSPNSGLSADSGFSLTATPMRFPPALFRAASSSQSDVAQQRGMHDVFNGLFDGIIDAIEYGFNQYRQTAGLVDVVINASSATGGRLQGPPLDWLIKSAASVAGWNGWYAVVRDAVAGGMERQWSVLANSVRVPGLPWYPMFAAYPGPTVPPTPNVPYPFATLSHDGTATSPYNLKNAMRSALRGNMDYSLEFFDSVATAFELPLSQWKGIQQVAQVMGTGPVPTFAPPYVPVGPVVGGTISPGPHINS